MKAHGNLLRRSLSYLAYPAMTGGAIAFGLWAITRHWPAWAVGVVVVVVAAVLVTLLEWIIPYSRVWAKPHGDRRTDFCHLVFSNRAFDVGTLVAVGVFAPLGEALSSRLGTRLWPHGWPLPLQALLAVVVFELPWYWIHRLEHIWAPLWRVHAVHHSSRRIYWWNFARTHPLDNLISAVAAFTPLSLLGVGDEPLALMAAFSGAHGMLQHSNIDLRTGFLDLFFSTARVHRWHHSPRRHEADANYSPRVMLWDHVFGSYRFRPDVAPPEDVGLGEDAAGFPESYVGQLLVPFRSDHGRKRHP
ncbi:sterol desaturase family protein [Polyangium fumosum]|uniref:sterol desaturase family protein n=1 Tax=Polyangium fumosum TaxID=889272 RepID=UPI00147808C0|nr:sterol desaturase family protein [Polyangium fumosum]